MEISQQKRLAYALRRKGVPESALPGLLEEARQAEEIEGAQFCVASFADKVPAGQRASAGKILGYVAVGFLIVALGGQLFVSGVLGIRAGFPAIAYYLLGVLVVLVGLVLISRYVDERPPRTDQTGPRGS